MCSWLAGARLVSLLGLGLSCLCLVPVILVHVMDRDHSLLVMPLLLSLRVSPCVIVKQQALLTSLMDDGSDPM